MFFSKKVPVGELVGEFITVSDDLGIKALNGVMLLTGNTSPDKIRYVNDSLENFKVLWPTSSCVWGAELKLGDAQRFCKAALTRIEKDIAEHPFGLETALEILAEAGSAENRFGKATALMIQRTLPDLNIDDQGHVISGANFISSLNYADFLVNQHKIAW